MRKATCNTDYFIGIGILDQEVEEEDEESTPVSPQVQPQSRTTTPADTPGVVAPEASPFIYSPTDVSPTLNLIWHYNFEANGTVLLYS